MSMPLSDYTPPLASEPDDLTRKKDVRHLEKKLKRTRHKLKKKKTGRKKLKKRISDLEASLANERNLSAERERRYQAEATTACCQFLLRQLCGSHPPALPLEGGKDDA